MNTATDLIRSLKSIGIMLSVSGDKLKVQAPAGIVTSEIKNQIVDHKPQIMAACALSDFIELVRITGACEHSILLKRSVIADELDQDDNNELLKTDRADRQDWAELLAYRLCMKRLGLPSDKGKTT